MFHRQDALDSVEFVTGVADTRWGGMRAAMGHPEPWALNYLAIGNEVSQLGSTCSSVVEWR